MIKVEINNKLIEQLDQIPITLRSGPFGRCLKKYGEPIAPRAESLARSSRESGSRDRWSRRLKNNPAFQNDSRKHMGVKVTKTGSSVYVGATYPKGNKQQFVMPVKKGDSYTRYHWGKPGELIKKISKNGVAFNVRNNSKPTTARFPKTERATVKAFDQMQSSAEAAFLAQLQKELKELRLG